MSDDPTGSHHHDALGHDGKDHVAVATGSGQTQSLDRALRPASTAVATATTRQHSLGRNQPHHHHHPPLAGLANQNGARTNAEAKYTHTHTHTERVLLCDSCLTFDLHLSSVTIRSLQPPRHPLLSCRQHSPTAPPTPLLWQRHCTLQPPLVTKVTESCLGLLV